MAAAEVGRNVTRSAAGPIFMLLRRPPSRRFPAAAVAAAAPCGVAAPLGSSLLLSLSSGRARQKSVHGLNSSSCPVLLPPTAPLRLLQKSLLISGSKMSKVAALGSSSFSSSTLSAVDTTPEDVLEFWFRGVGAESGVYMKKEWFRGGDEFDAQCAEKFGECLKLFSTGALDGWKQTVRGRLALVILLDQISRNVYRDSALSFSHDPTAIKITLDTIEQGWDKELMPSERQFLYMPLMHSESLGDHEIVDGLFEDLAAENSDNEKLHEVLIDVLEFERKHSAVLKKFGRYPTRNSVLGRPNTKEEEEFLASGGGW